MIMDDVNSMRDLGHQLCEAGGKLIQQADEQETAAFLESIDDIVPFFSSDFEWELGGGGHRWYAVPKTELAKDFVTKLCSRAASMKVWRKLRQELGWSSFYRNGNRVLFFEANGTLSEGLSDFVSQFPNFKLIASAEELGKTQKEIEKAREVLAVKSVVLARVRIKDAGE